MPRSTLIVITLQTLPRTHLDTCFSFTPPENKGAYHYILYTYLLYHISLIIPVSKSYAYDPGGGVLLILERDQLNHLIWQLFKCSWFILVCCCPMIYPLLWLPLLWIPKIYLSFSIRLSPSYMSLDLHEVTWKTRSVHLKHVSTEATASNSSFKCFHCSSVLQPSAGLL